MKIRPRRSRGPLPPLDPLSARSGLGEPKLGDHEELAIESAVLSRVASGCPDGTSLADLTGELAARDPRAAAAVQRAVLNLAAARLIRLEDGRVLPVSGR